MSFIRHATALNDPIRDYLKPFKANLNLQYELNKKLPFQANMLLLLYESYKLRALLKKKRIKNSFNVHTSQKNIFEFLINLISFSQWNFK